MGSGREWTRLVRLGLPGFSHHLLHFHFQNRSQHKQPSDFRRVVFSVPYELPYELCCDHTRLRIDMDPLSISASIIALLQLSSTIIGYLSDVKGGPKELQKIRLEICSVLPMLSILQDHAEQAKAGGLWSSTLLSLDGPNGPIQQFREALERLRLRLVPVEGWKKVGKAFTWPFEKD